MKKTLLLLLIALVLPITSFARIDVQCIVRTHHQKGNGWGAYSGVYSDPVKCTVSFISGAEFKIRRPSTEKYALIWFSRDECAVIKLEPKKTVPVEKLSIEDLPDITGGSGIVFGEKDNGEEIDDMGMPYRWEINFHDRNNNYEYVDPRLQRIWMSDYPLFI